MLCEVVSHSAETLVFLFLGIGIFTVEDPFKTVGFGSIITLIINLNIARFLNVVICSYLCNLSRTEQTKINYKT
jgi:NhaP-type Na+/H+ or K+/H+ antiporter